VIVSEHQLSLAIGKEGQNARLAARLSGYKVDIHPDKTAEQVEAEAAAVVEAAAVKAAAVAEGEVAEVAEAEAAETAAVAEADMAADVVDPVDVDTVELDAVEPASNGEDVVEEEAVSDDTDDESE
jgi:N utilization substance protein A